MFYTHIHKSKLLKNLIYFILLFFVIISSKELEPNLSAPNFKNSSASEILLIPPAAFILTPFDTFSENNLISSAVAPSLPNPVLVLIKFAPERLTILLRISISPFVK